MPSLNELNEFRNSFSNIANERENTLALDLPYESMPLPKQEAPPFDPGRPSFQADGFDPKTDNSAEIDFSDILPPDTGADAADTAAGGNAAAGDFDFSAFLGSLPGEPPTAAINDILPDPPPSFDDLFQETSTFAEDSISSGLPSDDFFNSLGVEVEDSLPDEVLPAEVLPIEDFPAEELPSDDLSGGFDMSGMASEDGRDEDEGDEENGALNLGGERRDGSFTSDEIYEDDFSPAVYADNMEENTPEFSAPLADSFAEDPITGFDNVSVTDRDDDSDTSKAEDSDTSRAEDFDSEDPLANFDADFAGGEAPADFETFAEEENIDMGGETVGPNDSAANLILDDVLPETDFDLSTELNEGPDEAQPFDAPTEFENENLTFDSDFDLGENTDITPSFDNGFDAEEQAADLSADFNTANFNTEESSFDLTPGNEIESPGIMPDFGDFGSDFSSETIELDTEDTESETSSDDIFGEDDFVLPGLDDLFDKNKLETIIPSAAQPKKSFFKRRKTKIAQIFDDDDHKETEEIQLTQEDVDKLLATLKSYPLNLRIACQEIIAEHVILPQQLSKIIRYLIKGAPAKECAVLAAEILGREIIVPRSFEKSTGEAWESERSSFAYIFVHNFLPVLRLFVVIAALLASVAYLGWRFVYIPLIAESLYQRGYERIEAGEFQRANELFQQAFNLHPRRVWFYRYAEAFIRQRRFMLAERKYEELLRVFPRDRRGVLDFARLQTHYLLNYERANQILQRQLLDFAPNDFDGLLAAGDNFFLWADSDPARFFDKYEEARFSWARILEVHGWQPHVVERMLRFFMRTDNLREVIYLRNWFDGQRGRVLSAYSLAELGGYLLDKQHEDVRGVPSPYLESIESVRDMLLQAVMLDVMLPEAHYHLARYHHALHNTHQERLTLENAIRAFDLAETESVRRRLLRVDTHYRYANLLINNREFVPAENNLIRGIELFEDFVGRNLITPSPKLGRLYASKGDLEFFAKPGRTQSALDNYLRAERLGWSPPEIQFRIGAAFYQLENWENAFEYFFRASSGLPLNRRVLYALGNTAYRRGNFFAAQGYFNRLIDVLESQRNRLPVLLPNDSPLFIELGERLMIARNNAGVVYEALANQTGSLEFRARALSLYAESARAWDVITRNPATMIRMRLIDMPGAPGVNQAFLNANNALRPSPDFTPQIFPRIDRDALEPSRWEELTGVGGLLPQEW